MKDFIESLSVSLKERFTNKFIGPFTLFLVILNWEKVLVFFYLGRLSYSEAVNLLKMDNASFGRVVLQAAMYALIYAVVSPYLGLFIHWIQSFAVEAYKKIVIKTEKKVEEEKGKLSALIADNLRRQQDNINSSNRSTDRENFEKLRSSYNEQDLRGVLGILNDHNFRQNYLRIERLKNYIVEGKVIDNYFKDSSLRAVQEASVEKLESLVELLESNKHIIHNDDYESELPMLKEKIEKISDDVLLAYRDFRNFKIESK